MKVLTGHLTDTNKKAIKAMFAANILQAKVNNVYYSITESNGVYKVIKCKMDRGMIPCGGSELRMSKYVSTFTMN